MYIYITCIYTHGVLISLSVGKQTNGTDHGDVVVAVSGERRIIYLSAIARGVISDEYRNVYDIMYTGIAEREVRLLCYDCGGLYGSEPRKHRAVYYWWWCGGGLRLRDERSEE